MIFKKSWAAFGNYAKNLLFALRPAHWIKNFLIFLPLIFAERITSLPDVLKELATFALFCMVASAGYLVNDLIDLSYDRNHRIKKERPLASGKVTVSAAAALSGMFFITSLGGAFVWVNPECFAILFCYVVLTMAYSLFLKNIVIIDVMILASFYILRILAGIVAIDVRVSHWMIVCVGLLALFLGFNKRRHEIEFMGDAAALHRSVLSRYNAYFIDQMVSIVTAATVVSYTLYVIDPETVIRFGTRGLILTVPFVYYGIFRYFYLVHKRRKGGDPVRIFLSDKMMVVNSILWVLTSIFVIYTGIQI